VLVDACASHFLILVARASRTGVGSNPLGGQRGNLAKKRAFVNHYGD
jgi:hypothetical protein